MTEGASPLETTTTLPIAQLTPLLDSPSSRSLRAIVTLTWPYSSATGSLAFLLAEPDFRLRNLRGQVRVQFSGSSAQFVSKAGVASGDEIILSLDGVEWIQTAVPAGTPGRGVDVELKFTERLLLQAHQNGSEQPQIIDINHPSTKSEQVQLPTGPSKPSLLSDPSTGESITGPPKAVSAISGGDEWSSPAFIKRARNSYGGLFDTSSDLFSEEDGTRSGRGRKRMRLSSSWRYSSRSPSLDTEDPPAEIIKTPVPESAQKISPIMTDEGVQTVGLEGGDDEEAYADFSISIGSRAGNGFGGTEYAISPPLGPRSQLQEVSALSNNQVLLGPMDDSLFSNIPDLLHSPNGIIHTPSGIILENVSPGFSPQITFQREQSPRRIAAAQFFAGSRSTSDAFSESLKGFIPINRRLDQQPGRVSGSGDIVQSSSEKEVDSPSTRIISLQSANNRSTNNTVVIGAPPLNTSGSASAGLDNISTEAVLDSARQTSEHFSETHHPPNQHEEIPWTESSPTPYSKTTHYNQDGHISEAKAPNMQPPLHNPLYTAQLRYQHMRDHSLNSSNGDSRESDDEEGNGLLDESLRSELQASNGDSQQLNSSSPRQPTPNKLQQDNRRPGQDNDEYLSDKGYEDVDSDIDAEAEIDDNALEDHNQGLETHSDFTTSQNVQAQDIETFQGLAEDDNWTEGETEDDDDDDDDDEREEENSDEEDDVASQFGDEESTGAENENSGSVRELYEEEFSEDDRGNTPPPSLKTQPPVIIDLLSSDDEDEDYGNNMEAQEGRPIPLFTHETQRIARPSLSDDEEYLSEHSNIVENEISHEDTIDPSLNTNAFDTNSLQSGEGSASEEDSQEGYGSDSLSDSKDDKLSEQGQYMPAGGPIQEPESERAYSNEEALDIMSIALQAESAAHSNEDIEMKEDEQSMTQASKTFDVNDNRASIGEQVPQKSDEELSAGEADQMENPHSSGLISEPISHTEISSQDTPLDLHSVNVSDLHLPEAHIEPISDTPSRQHQESLEGKPEEQHLDSGNAQLPTPVDTQVFQHSSPVATSFASDYGLESSILHESMKVVETPAENMLDGVRFSRSVRFSQEPVSIDSDAENLFQSQGHLQVTESILEVVNYQQDVPKTPALENVIAFQEKTEAESHSRSSENGTQMEGGDERIFEPATEEIMPPQARPSSKSDRNSISAVSDRVLRSSSVQMDESSQEIGHDASAELAASALTSPTKQLRVAPLPSSELKLRLNKALRSELTEFTSLKVLRFHLNQKLDVLAIATTTPEEPQRTKTRQYLITFNVVDPSIAPSSVVEVQIFRPYKDALPDISAGDGLLLRSFLVTSVKNNGFSLRSDQSGISSWAVFKGDGSEPEIRGPPVEYGAAERGHIEALKMWHRNLDSAAISRLEKANGKKADGIKRHSQ